MTRHAQLTERIAHQLEALAVVAEGSGMRSIATEIRVDRLPALREGRMTMVVLGEFNHGKSTAINALLGADVLPTGITPTTSVITHIRRGAPRVVVVRDSGAEVVTAEQLRAFVTTDPPDDLRHVEVYADAPFLTDGLVVVDTPGVNDISQQRVEITYGYVPRADVVLYVLDATQALKRSELTFIETRLLKNNHDRLFFLLGKTDALSAEEVDEIVTHVKSRLAPALGDVPVFPVSARRAMRGADPAFDVFREAISSYLDRQRAQIVVDGGLKTGLRLASVIEQGVAIEQGALGLAGDELARRVEAIRSRAARSRTLVAENVALIDARAAEITAATRDNVATFARDFASALPREIDRASTDDVRRYLPDFIHDTFKDWLETEGTHVAARLELLAEEVIAITNQHAAEALGDIEKELGVRTRNLDLEVDTFGYDVGVFALGALGVSFLAFSNLLVGGLLTLAAPVLAFAVKGKVDAAIREKAAEQGLAAIGGASAKVDEELRRAVESFAAKLRQFVEDAGDRLYKQVSEALDRVVEERAKHAHDAGAFAAQLGAVRGQVTEIAAALAALRREATTETD